jgi:ubiquinone/menaquinone biosynthesis C-methylase UbiE
MTVRDAYNTWAATYDTDRNLTRDLDQQVTRATLGALRCNAILELGCGTGKNTGFLAQMGTQVYALDFAESMIRQAQAKVRQANVRFIVADLIQSWPVADHAIDLVVCNLVLEHIADLSPIFAEAARCLAPSGRFFVCELHPFKQYLGSKARLQHNGELLAPPAFVHHMSAFVEAATAAGFTLARLQEWWDAEDQQAPPRLVSFLFAQ